MHLVALSFVKKQNLLLLISLTCCSSSRKLKEYRNILLTFSLVLACNLGFSNTNAGQQLPSGQEQQQEGERKSRQTIINPDGDEMGASHDENYLKEDSDELIDSKETLTTEDEVQKDTVEDDSVSKYNFIFYLLYKFKYDTTP